MNRWECTITANPGGLDVPTSSLMRAHTNTLRASLTSHFSHVLSSDDVRITVIDRGDDLFTGSAVVGARAGRGLGLLVSFELRRLSPGEPPEPAATPEPNPPVHESGAATRGFPARPAQLTVEHDQPVPATATVPQPRRTSPSKPHKERPAKRKRQSRTPQQRCLQLLAESTLAANIGHKDRARGLLAQARELDNTTVEAFIQAVREHGLPLPNTQPWRKLIGQLPRR